MRKMLRTKEQYHDKLAKMRPNIYIGGEKVGREDPPWNQDL
jgi:aromatic ring hydroxylase